ncbi:hypothetical protein [Gaetbulibacter sp. PBL-D1]|uniref:hypothetical protein n=1 Tax=Gaetbulibacter sp. PBL-D1 TaxID=3422594 RepID=UPI003D2EE1BF
MKEDIAKKLIQKSTINTSEDFTEKLMLKLEAEKATERLPDVQYIQMFRFAMIGTIGIGIICFLLIFFDFLPKLNMFNVQLKISKMPLLVVTTLFLLLGTNHILKTQQLASFQDKS